MITVEQAEKQTILKVLAGSHIHGLNVATSDQDHEAIIIEPLEQAMGLERPFEELIRESTECDVKYVSLRKWCQMALKGNPNFLLPLFAPQTHILKCDARASQLRDMASMFVSKQAIRSHLGYMSGQRQRMLKQAADNVPIGRGGGHGKPRQDLVDKFGYDVKFGMHLLRLGTQGVELLRTGRVTLPMGGKDREYLLSVRRGEVELEDVLRVADNLEQQMKDEYDACSLPEQPDYNAVQKFMLTAYIRSWSAARKTADIMEDAARFAQDAPEVWGGQI